ncbi:SDR family NAD(P)-dependent oxidoreductase [Legionella anisa]|uniref:3-beta hydroxysteroid dehydrogenase n=1 Tax=Legionella anisa TaxID=28082 RepID=A0AAX0WQ34_9GAMM|nr:SDR family NAD(P)-dependent oxidoreductase [Legionella anisa]AWN75440.1 3-beta hydroxysteroid dehydrogenase [Legionella anisa]KTC72814.1 3-beta hydroxysteroid dehydrogenase/isomerase [Legionella anisa]MBN5934551.1 SDR family NAD(P)-dependent oxidoreductase [Legionella anisa]MCW8424376.1 SDR family NAD(P)-dependent oxidoreductase [Legionella anisa]MCW8446506.1 SDR family NAD(P)-dependent oxidoreductase [Legionella anisa]
MACVVTGATGCLGLNLTQRLVADGHEVIALGRNEQLGKILTQSGARFISLDLLDKEKLKKVARDAQTIFHCAALSSPWGRYKDFYEANVQGTQHVIEATPPNARLVHVSSPSIYFNFTEQHNIKEDAALPSKPANDYVKTKLLAESLVDKAFQEKNMNVITIRPRAIFGPYDRAILPRILQNEKNGILPIIGNGENRVDITYVENVVESLLLAAQANQQFCGKKYNITNGEPKTLMTIISELFSALQKPFIPKFIPYSIAKTYAGCMEKLYNLPFIHKEPRLTRYSAAVLCMGQTLNIEAAQKDLGYQPKITITQGIDRFAKWYQKS